MIVLFLTIVLINHYFSTKAFSFRLQKKKLNLYVNEIGQRFRSQTNEPSKLEMEKCLPDNSFVSNKE